MQQLLWTGIQSLGGGKVVVVVVVAKWQCWGG